MPLLLFLAFSMPYLDFLGMYTKSWFSLIIIFFSAYASLMLLNHQYKLYFIAYLHLSFYHSLTDLLGPRISVVCHCLILFDRYSCILMFCSLIDPSFVRILVHYYKSLHSVFNLTRGVSVACYVKISVCLSFTMHGKVLFSLASLDFLLDIAILMDAYFTKLYFLV